MTHLAIQLSGAALAGLVWAFMAVNLGLRLLPEGRAFLASARDRGQLLASPITSRSASVSGMFLLAMMAAVVAAVLAFFRIGAMLEPAVGLTPPNVVAVAPTDDAGSRDSTPSAIS